MNDRAPSVPGDVLLHPVAIAALTVWIVNDHVLKQAFPCWLTGKLSDVACLVVCPLLVVAAVELRWNSLCWSTERLVLLAALVTFGAIMCSIRIWPLAADAYRYGLGAAQWCVFACLRALTFQRLPAFLPVQLVMDPTDIATLPSLIVPAVL